MKPANYQRSAGNPGHGGENYFSSRLRLEPARKASKNGSTNSAKKRAPAPNALVLRATEIVKVLFFFQDEDVVNGDRKFEGKATSPLHHFTTSPVFLHDALCLAA
jgi:hypothetical protein